MSADDRIDRSPERAPVFSWDAPEVFLRLKIEEQRAALESLDSDKLEMWLCLLDEDPRKGRRDLAQRLRRQREREQLAQERWRALSDFDSKMAAGDILAGVDEVGRGPLAGPVTAAAVILPQNFHAPGLDDSKRLSSDAREFWSTRIRAEATAWAVADLPAGEVDRLGIREAVFRVMRSAVDLLDVRPARVIVDGRDIPPGLVNARAVVRGDSRSLSVAAASVVAKVHRDALMCAADLDHPVYGFAGHKGYGSPEHLKVLRNMGPCPLHRRSFLGRILNTREEEAGEPR